MVSCTKNKGFLQEGLDFETGVRALIQTSGEKK